MKPKILIFLFLFISFYSKAAELRSIKMDSTTLYYYFSESSIQKKKGLLLFMHGAVSQFMKQTESKSVPIEILLENNAEFLPALNKDGYDVILPIAYNEFNWLVMKGKNFIDTLAIIYKGYQQKVILAGFSDGGTGAYKYFYTSPKLYDGVMIFNGYPQHQNFYKTVDYLKVTDKKVLFFSQNKDKVIPYEFLLREYRRQKMVNIETYFLLKKGHHRFNEYAKKDFEEGLSLLDTFIIPNKPCFFNADDILIYAPVDGFLKGGKVIELYKFRKKTVRKYGMCKAEYDRKDYSYKGLLKLLKKTPVIFYSVEISKAVLLKNDKIEFNIEHDGFQYRIMLNNYLKMTAF